MNKRIVAINALSFGSTGKIMQGIAHEAAQSGYLVDMFVGAGDNAMYPDSRIHKISSRFWNKLAINLSKLTGLEGCFAIIPTLRLLRKIDAIDPDVIHLHILHHSYVNLHMLFRYLKKKGTPVVWTLHDCWSFTGHCPHFVYEKCQKWQTGCFNCPRYNQYPRSLFDNSKFMWRWKKKWFSGLSNLTLVTPSFWLADLLKESYLKDYPSCTVHNGIDLEVFCPTQANIREKYGIAPEEKIVLGVASSWSERKGLDVFAELAERLPEDYRIILVGTNEQIDSELPKNIISIHRTENQQALAEIYSAADVFANPTREDTFPTVNVEALACGTPVVTFCTGGSPESVDSASGLVVPCDDVDKMEQAIKRVCDKKLFTADACRKRAEQFDANKQFCKYLDIYEKYFTNR
ncbi:MAG: glycosyltransferase [Clostridia bacterium]|nr:glycosyltransferase [Clostridia bacterium]